MLIKEIIDAIEEFAPLSLQEDYDNAGLVCGDPTQEVSSILICIDITEEVVDEAILGGQNLILSHHPLFIQSLKNIRPDSYVKRCLIKAIKHDICMYAAHTNMDSVTNGVSGKMADKLELINREVLKPTGKLYNLSFYTPRSYAEKVRNAVLDTGAGFIGNYSRCSFSHSGTGSFRAEEHARPFVGEIGQEHLEEEIKTEITVPAHLLNKSTKALLQTHPYEEPVWNIIPLNNADPRVGFGIVGELEEEVDTYELLQHIKNIFHCNLIRHTAVHKSRIKKIAVCGGSGAFLTAAAIAAQADLYVSGDFKYHDFFLAENRIIMADIGHYESEQYTKEIFYELVTKKISKFAVQFSKTYTNPINYL